MICSDKEQARHKKQNQGKQQDVRKTPKRSNNQGVLGKRENLKEEKVPKQKKTKGLSLADAMNQTPMNFKGKPVEEKEDQEQGEREKENDRSVDLKDKNTSGGLNFAD